MKAALEGLDIVESYVDELRVQDKLAAKQMKRGVSKPVTSKPAVANDAGPSNTNGARPSSAATTVQATSVASKPVIPAHEEIARMAYLVWLEGGCRHGHDEEDWIEAQRRLLGS